MINNYKNHKKHLLVFVTNLLNLYFKDNKKINKDKINKSFNQAYDRLIYCFSKIQNEYYFDKRKKGLNLNHLNSDQMATFLYFFSNTCYKNNLEQRICDKIYYLNKMLNSVDIFYEVKMPDIFLLIHPVGTVLGRADYSNYLIIYQGVNVGSNKNIYPTLSKYVTLRPSSSILGNSKMGENSELATGSILIDNNLSKNQIYFGNPKENFTKLKKNLNEVWIK